MKSKALLLAASLFLGALSLSSRAESEVSIDFFYQNLSPYGDWVEVGDYGTCWRPRDVDADWSPYTDGYWSYTDAGWTWISYEDFGDICYHYGRWVRANDIGWCWVPDTEWGPAWVSWRKTDEYVGWAPLPPEARWRPSVGFSVWVDDSYDIGPTYYNFCPIVEFSAPVIRHVCVPRSRISIIFGSSINITNITYNSYGRHAFCGGPDYTYFSRHVSRPIPALKLVQNNTTIINNNVTIVNNQRIYNGPRNVVAGNTLQVFAPKVVNTSNTNVVRPKVTKVVPVNHVDRGWASIQDPNEVRKLRDKVKTEAGGRTPETLPAKPVEVGDLRPLPDKADPQAPTPPGIATRPTRPGKGDQKPGFGEPPTSRPQRPDRPDGPGNIGQTPGQPTPSVMPRDRVNQPTADLPTSRPGRPTQPKGEPGVGPAVMPRNDDSTTQIAPVPDSKHKPGSKKGRPTAETMPTPPPALPPTEPRGPATVDTDPLKKPFRNPEPEVPAGRKGSKPGRPTTPDADMQRELEQRRQLEAQRNAQEGQRRMAEQAERQRDAAAQTERARREAEMRREQSRPQPQVMPRPTDDGGDNRRRQAESIQRQQQQMEAAQRAQRQQQQMESAQRAQRQQLEAAQRQQSMQRQAEMQQRQAQAQRQMQQQQQQRPQSMPQPQRRPEAQAPNRGRPPQGQQLTPEQLEALKKKNR